MTEVLRTAIFVGIALVLSIGAYFSQPKRQDFPVADLINTDLFDEFDDPSIAGGLRIVRYDQDLGQKHNFEVVRNKSGAWSIPSHSGYPADAADQMRQAALCLVGLKVLGVATSDPGEHQLFGVIDPDQDELTLGEKGVGLLVRFEDDKGTSLADLIIGKPVRDAPEQRFVRIPGQDLVYAVEFDADQLSTKFQDWIESDLLQLNTFDVQRVAIQDYSVVTTTEGMVEERRFDATVTFNTTDSDWELNDFVTYRRRKDGQSEPVPAELLPSEELNATKLNDLKTALGDLKIVDVRRKPGGLKADLTTEQEFLKDPQTYQSLVQLGYIPDTRVQNKIRLLAASGEVHVLMAGGYEYVLRFGNVATGETESDGAALNRYLFVTTRVNPSAIPKPQLDSLPEDAPATSSSGADDTEEAQRKLAAQRETITKENQRKLDEWNERKRNAKERVRQLNNRFADWYYVISEDVFKKIHLSTGDLLRESEQARVEGIGVDAFRALQEQGLAPRDTETPQDSQ